MTQIKKDVYQSYCLIDFKQTVSVEITFRIVLFAFCNICMLPLLNFCEKHSMPKKKWNKDNTVYSFWIVATVIIRVIALQMLNSTITDKLRYLYVISKQTHLFSNIFEWCYNHRHLSVKMNIRKYSETKTRFLFLWKTPSGTTKSLL